MNQIVRTDHHRDAAQQALTSLIVGLRRAEEIDLRGYEYAAKAIREDVLQRAAADLTRLCGEQQPMQPGHDGRAPEFHEPVNRLEGEKDQIEAVNIFVDQLEELAHMDERFEVLKRLACRKDGRGDALINQDQHQAGRRLQRDYLLMAIEPKAQGMVNGGGGGGCTVDLADAKCDALMRFGKAMKHVGHSNEILLKAIVIDDRPLAEVAVTICGYTQSAVKAKRAQKAVVLLLRGALDSLVAFYGPRLKKRKGIEAWTNPVPHHPFHGER